MASIGEACSAWGHVELCARSLQHDLSAGDRPDEVVSGMEALAEHYERAITLTEQCISPELSARATLSKAIERALALGINLEDISAIYYDEIDRRI